MKRFLASGPVWLALLVCVGCQRSPTTGAAAAAPERESGRWYLDHAQPRLATLSLWVGREELTTEIARRTVEIATGMMFRTNFAEGEAMLFVFARPEPRAFYMRNTSVPLSLAYLDPEGVILEIHDLQPKEETPVASASDRVQYALEVPQGWFERHGIRPGVLVSTSQGTFNEINWLTLRPNPVPGR